MNAKIETNGNGHHDPYLIYTQLLYRAFHHFNKVLAKGILKEPVITIQNRGRKSALGWHAEKRWRIGTGAELNEINLSAETLNRSWEDSCETLIHEMGHLWNNQLGIDDCSSTQWHNKRFKARAEELGLKVTKMKGKGWAQTELGPLADAAIKSMGIKEEDVPDIFRQEKRRRVSGPKNTFIIVDPANKAKFLELQGNMKQTEFFAKLLEVYEGVLELRKSENKLIVDIANILLGEENNNDEEKQTESTEA